LSNNYKWKEHMIQKYEVGVFKASAESSNVLAQSVDVLS
jgi:hypothetical protein